jgi:NTE family protein
MDADLVLEGGGVKGIGLVGAISVLEEHGYVFHRVAGTSAGAIVGALVAAKIPASDLQQIMRSVNYRDFQDDSFLDHGGLVGKAIEIITHEGIYKGDFLLKWLTDQLAAVGKHTFADLRLDDPGAAPDLQHTYGLVVMTSDLSAGRLVQLPWDYQERLALDPDSEKIAEAVRMSMSIPIFFQPWRIGDSCFVDGGMLSNFPVAVFDRHDGVEPRWPTFGIKLSARPDANQRPTPTNGPIELLKAMVATMTNFHDGMYIDEPSVCARTIFVDCGQTRATDFDLSPEQAETLYQSGRAAATGFLETWDFEKYKATYLKPAQPAAV